MELLTAKEQELMRKSCESTAGSRRFLRISFVGFVAISIGSAIIVLGDVLRLTDHEIDSHEFMRTLGFVCVLFAFWGTQWGHARYSAIAASTIAKLHAASVGSEGGSAIQFRN
jgi:hypothetical protein